MGGGSMEEELPSSSNGGGGSILEVQEKNMAVQSSTARA